MFRLLYKAIIRQYKILKDDYYIHHTKMFLFRAVEISTFTARWVLFGAETKYKQKIKYIKAIIPHFRCERVASSMVSGVREGQSVIKKLFLA